MQSDCAPVERDCRRISVAVLALAQFLKPRRTACRGALAGSIDARACGTRQARRAGGARAVRVAGLCRRSGTRCAPSAHRRLGAGAKEFLSTAPADCGDSGTVPAFDDHSARVLHPETLNLLRWIDTCRSASLLFRFDPSFTGTVAGALAARTRRGVLIYVGHVSRDMVE
jgi:hypothetical protein